MLKSQERESEKDKEGEREKREMEYFGHMLFIKTTKCSQLIPATFSSSPSPLFRPSVSSKVLLCQRESNLYNFINGWRVRNIYGSRMEKKKEEKNLNTNSLSPKNIKKTTHNRKQTKTRELNIKIVMKNEKKKKKKRLERGLFSVGDFFFVLILFWEKCQNVS